MSTASHPTSPPSPSRLVVAVQRMCVMVDAIFALPPCLPAFAETSSELHAIYQKLAETQEDDIRAASQCPNTRRPVLWPTLRPTTLRLWGWGRPGVSSSASRFSLLYPYGVTPAPPNPPTPTPRALSLSINLSTHTLDLSRSL